jgi:hypothetical protein
METIIIRPGTTAKSKLVLNFLKKERIKAEVYKEPTREQILKGIEKGAKETALYLKGKIQLKEAKQLLSEL